MSLSVSKIILFFLFFVACFAGNDSGLFRLSRPHPASLPYSRVVHKLIYRPFKIKKLQNTRCLCGSFSTSAFTVWRADGKCKKKNHNRILYRKHSNRVENRVLASNGMSNVYFQYLFSPKHQVALATKRLIH